MDTKIRNAIIGIAGGAAATAAIRVLRSRRSKELNTAVITIDMTPAPGDRGVEMRLASYELSKERLKQLLRDFKAEIEAGEVPTGERYS